MSGAGPAPTDAFVEVALELAGYHLDSAALARVKLEFERIATIAAALEGLSHHAEPLASYRP